jgi:hypothetical protein
MDSFCESMDSYRFVGHESGLKKIRFVSWITNPDLKRFGSYRDHESSQLSKDSTCFHESNESLRILSTMAWNESLKIEIRESEILTNPDSRIRTLKIRIVDSFRKKKNPKLLDSFRFGRIRIRIPHP